MQLDRQLSLDEKMEISQFLSNHHTIFQTFWTVGKPIFSHVIPTAAVGFDRFGHVLYMIINPDFWDSLDIINKAFVIAHECLHIILNHGKRGNEYKDHETVNVSQDIVINEMLFKDFKFNKYQINGWENYCLVETVFSSEEIREHGIHTKGSFHYYMNILEKAGTPKNTVDNHSGMNGSAGDNADGEGGGSPIDQMLKDANLAPEQMMNSLFEEVDDKMDDKTKFQLGKILEEELKSSKAGTSPLGAYLQINPNPVPKKRKWETIVKDHIKSVLKYETVEKDSWISKSRRSSLLGDELMMQGPWNHEVPKKEKYKIVFFLDSSGSCYHLKDRFIDMMKSIPEDKFEILPYSFDCAVYPIDLKTGNVRGGGGTYFHILDAEIKKITNNSRHPDAIFVVSDGDGDTFYPEKPKLWHWILTPRHSLRWIPAESIKHDMKDFS